LSEAISYYLLGIMRHYKKLIIPDLAGKSLSNGMTHGLIFFKKQQYEYLGILSMMHELPITEEYDYFFSISGPEPQRTVLEKVIMELLPKITDKKVVITLGKSEQECTSTTQGNVTTFNFLNSEKQNEIMAKSKFIITRSGYSTLMDLAELGKKALLIPTDGQPEQEYLAEYLHKTGVFYARRLHELHLPEDLTIGEQYPGFITKEKTAAAVQRFSAIVLK
jgi:UDP-N-acetylglucosamine transferase subunit ALG13